MRVIYLNAEDDADDTVVPRFMKANGERSRLFFISEEKQRLNFSDEMILTKEKPPISRRSVVDDQGLEI
jgi:hypothetical protein